MGAPKYHTQTITYFCDCCICGVPIYGPERKRTQAKQEGDGFYCINGHSIVFKEPENKKLEKKLERKQKELEWALRDKQLANDRAETEKRRAAAYKGKFHHMKKKISEGTCPCCDGSFKNVRRHMRRMHPEFVKEAEALEEESA